MPEQTPIRTAAIVLAFAATTLAVAGCGTRSTTPTPPRTGFVCYDWKNNPDYTVATKGECDFNGWDWRDTAKPPPGLGLK